MMAKTKHIPLILLLALLVMPVVAIAGAATVTIVTDKISYVSGETLKVSGTVSPVTAGQDVAIQVYGPTSDLRAVDQVTPLSDGTYSKSVMVFSASDPSGTWTVKATYQGVSAQASFAFASALKIALNVAVDVGAVYFKGEVAEFFILTSYSGDPLDAEVTATLYSATGVVATLSTSKIATGLYKAAYTIPADAQSGTYVLMVKASLSTAQYEGKAVAIRSFDISSKLVEIGTKASDAQTAATAAKTAADAAKVASDAAKASADAAKTTADAAKASADAAKTAATDAKTAATSANTAAAGAKTAAESAQAAMGSISTAVYLAVVLSLVAAIAAVYAVISIQRKIAG